MREKITMFWCSTFLIISYSLPTVSEAALSSARFARSRDIWGWKYFLENLDLGIVLGKSGAGSNSNLQKSPIVQKSRAFEQHNWQHKRNLKSHQAQQKPLATFSEQGCAISGLDENTDTHALFLLQNENLNCVTRSKGF